MAITSIKPDAQLLDSRIRTRSGSPRQRFSTSTSSVPERVSALAVQHDDGGDGRDIPVDLRLGARGLCDHAHPLQARSTVGGLIFLAYLVPPSILFIPLSQVIHVRLFDTPFALILTYPTFLIPFCTGC